MPKTKQYTKLSNRHQSSEKRKIQDWHYQACTHERPTEHQGETIEEFLKRGGKITKVEFTAEAMSHDWFSKSIRNKNKKVKTKIGL